jgi:hypothetical protein
VSPEIGATVFLIFSVFILDRLLQRLEPAPNIKIMQATVKCSGFLPEQMEIGEEKI